MIGMVQIPYTNKELIIALSIGDGHIHKQSKGINAYLDITHSQKQYDYALWKNDLLIHNGFNSHITRKYNTCKHKKIQTYRVLTKTDKVITEVYNNLYTKGKKNMKYILENLSPFILSIWYMDDGSKKVKKKIKKKNGEVIVFNSGYIDAYMLATNGFSFDDCEKLCDVLYKKYEIIGHIQKDRCKPRISISDNKSKKIFKELIIPYMNSSMLYKINGIMTCKEAMLLDVNIGITEGIKES